MKELAKKWCVFNGKKGTDKQIEKVIKQFKGLEQNLERLIKERGL